MKIYDRETLEQLSDTEVASENVLRLLKEADDILDSLRKQKLDDSHLVQSIKDIIKQKESLARTYILFIEAKK